MEGRRQLRLLLWRDYLIRKRKFITLTGVLWATGIMIGAYSVRINIDNLDFPTCQFAARALPSAGMLPFLQSFICSVNNECSPMDKYQEIPSYNNSKLTQIQGKLSPLFNASVLELAGAMPDAVKLLATVASAADEPTFIDFSKNGLKLMNLFKSPSRVKRYVTSRIQLDDDVVQSLMTSEIRFQGILAGNMDLCSPDAISQTLVVQNSDHLQIISARLCALSKHDLQMMLMDLLYEVNFSKYIKMLGNMYSKISGDTRLTGLGDFVTAVLRMTKLQHFLPPEATAIFYGKKSEFSYLKLDLIPKFVELFAPTFGETDQYQSIKELADIAVTGIQYISKIFGNISNDTDVMDNGTKAGQLDMDKMNKMLDNIEAVATKADTIEPFTVLSKLSNIIIKFLPKDKKHDFLFYSTLLSKLMESMLKVIEINMHIEERTYNVTLRNPEAVKVMQKLDPVIVGKAFEALVSAERTQILTSNINAASEIFCDVTKLQKFLLVSPAQTESAKKELCSDAWKVFVDDLVKSFGVGDVKNNINEMASLLIQETMGKDTSPLLYSIDQVLDILRSFSSSLVTMDAGTRSEVPWRKLLAGGLARVVDEKAHLGKLMLISVHGAIAKEIVKQNAILQYKIAPVLININTFVGALNKQLASTPAYVSEGLRGMYGEVVQTVLMTANDDAKTYRSLSTHCRDIACFGGDNASRYLQFPPGVDTDKLSDVLCNASTAIEAGLKNDSIVSKAIMKIMRSEHTALSEVNWTELINNIQKLYSHLDEHYPYLFEYSTYAMDNATQEKVRIMCDNAKEYWFGIRNLQRAMHLSLNLGFRLLDILDYGIFDMTSETWLKIKFVATKTVGPLNVIDDTVKLVTALLTNSTHESRLPPITVEAMNVIVPNLPQFIMDTVFLIIHDNTDIEPIISLMNASPPWPCSNTSLSEHLMMTSTSQEAIAAMETLLCMDRSLQDEWIQYFTERDVKLNMKTNYNTTQYAPHLFLKASSVFNALVEDITLVKEAYKQLVDLEASDQIGLVKATKDALVFANSTEGLRMLSKFFAKFDTVLSSIDTAPINTDVSLNALWEGYTACIAARAGGCVRAGRALWAGALRVLPVLFETAAEDMITYFTEVNAPEHDLLQVLGFTRSTALHSLYERLPEFIGVLVNSYWDYGFMSQIRRATQTQFWDCDSVVSALVLPPGSKLQEDDIKRVKPYICPSLIYWLSLPRDDNVLFNIVAKPQYYFYSFHVKDANGSFEKSFSKGMKLADVITDLSKENKTTTGKDELSLESLKVKLTKFIDNVINYRLKETDETYKLFSEINKQQFTSHVYLTRTVAMISKLARSISNITIDDNFITEENIKEEDIDKVTADLVSMKNIFKRKALDVIAIHYDLLTEVLWRQDDSYNLVNAMEHMCLNLNGNTSSGILADDGRVKAQICAKNYKVLYGAVHDTLDEDYTDARQSLVNLVKVLQNGDEGEVVDIIEFLNNRTELVKSLKHSISSSYDLGLPIYLKHLQFNLQGYRVLLAFLSGGDWWAELRRVYDGPESRKFFGYVEQGFEVADHFVNNLDGIHLVRLIRDINLNASRSFCAGDLALAEYVPDAGALAAFKQQLCAVDRVELFRELPPLLVASQGYEAALKMSKDINYSDLDKDMSYIASNIGLISNGPKAPTLPAWVTQEKLATFRTNIINLLSKETLTKMVFGLMSNAVDAGTLFLDNSQCTLCSQMTTWFKQLNLQLFKKQEYDSLLCQLHTLTLEDVYYTLKNDFHWDMFVRELISSRNYTSYELNKSLTQFLALTKAHLLEDMRAPTTKLADCLLANVTRNAFGNATLFFQVVSRTAKLLRAELPHLHRVEGITDLPYLKQLHTRVAHRVNLYRPLRDYLRDGADLRRELQDRPWVHDDAVLGELMEADVNLREANNGTEDISALLRLNTNQWEYICVDHDCGDIFNIVNDNLNRTKIEHDLPTFQSSEFWQFSFISSILGHIEEIFSHVARLSGAASYLDVSGVVEGRLAAMLDMLASILMDDTVHGILYSMKGLIRELQPLLQDSPLQVDLQALYTGLGTLHQFKSYLVEEADLRVKVSTYFPNAESIEAGLTALGINNTNFWSLAAPRIHAGYLQFKPVVSSRDRNVHISSYLCDTDALAQVLSPAELDVVSAEEVSAAAVEQFCALDEDTLKEMAMVLLRNADYATIIDKVKDFILTKLYSASELSEEQGAGVVRRLPRLAAALPPLRAGLADLMRDLKGEPLFEDLKDFSSVGNLFTSSEFLGHAGRMLCGAPFRSVSSRLLSNVIKSEQPGAGASQAQLDALPTEFCRSMYRDIVSMEGGKIVWSFVKPLLMGRVLYTPPAPRVRRIIRQANSSFATMIEMSSLVHSFSSALPALDLMAAHREGVSALQHLVSNPGMEGLRRQILGDVEIDVDVEGMFQNVGDLKGMGKLVSKASELLRCFNLDRFVAADNETTLMQEAARLTQLNEFSAGLVFLNEDKLSQSLSNVEYKIRMDIENVPTTVRKRAVFWTPGPESSFIENMRYFRGFIQIQDMVDKAIIQLSAEESAENDLEGSRRKRQVEAPKELDWAVYTQQQPYPCYQKDYFQSSLYESQALVVCFSFALLFTVASVTRFIVQDKESGNTMLMSVMGVDLSYHTLSWFVTSCCETWLTMACVTLVLHCGGVLPRTEPSLLLALLMLFGVSVLSFCYMMSKLFTSASLAAVCVSIAYLMSFMPFVVILSLEAVISLSTKLLVCVSMSSSLSYGLMFLTQLEAAGRGATWHDLFLAVTDEDISLASIVAMLIFDSLLYLFVGYLIDRYNGVRTLSSHIITSEKDKAGVSIVNVSKTYSSGRRAKLALKNVSVELHKGQVTTLLGHNGAGKTTLTNILTGMVRPSSGHVVVRGGASARVGVCPQHDVLVDCLTAREHVQLYASLAARLSPRQLREEIDRMLAVLSLGRVAERPVRQLSGGTRRRVCVALAFVARGHLVSLDEPTSGVDPNARREIWDMIVQLKAERTILLTTHHLDEAEILSDQIVIMHKGEVHTTGSPIEIKRSLGSGYHLTVTLAEGDGEERAKRAVTAVRARVSNASVLAAAAPLELVLPFYDAHGANNDFLQLCTTLEEQQEELGIASFTLDCSSLEQVFCDIVRNADNAGTDEYKVREAPLASSTESGGSSSLAGEGALVRGGGPRRGSRGRQLRALLRARWLHLLRNRSLLFMLIVLPTLFVTVAMAFSTLRPPPDNELSLPLAESLYAGSTQYLLSEPSIHSEQTDPAFARRVMTLLQVNKTARMWTPQDSPQCNCTATRQACAASGATPPQMMILPDVDTLNSWITDSHDLYLERRYGGFSSTLKNNKTNLIMWYNNKGYHAMPAYLNTLNNAILRAVAGRGANITTYSHPLKISKEQLNKDTLYQHVADAGVSALVLVALSAAAAGGAAPLVAARRSKQKTLQRLCAVSPALYCLCQLIVDLTIMLINMALTASMMLAFGFPVFVERNNLPAICLLIMLFGYACCNLVHVLEKLFSCASLASMLLFCGNAFLGLAGITVLLILDIISDSDATDNARWVLHKVFMLSPQFVLGDGLLEVAKNTIQAQVLYRFGMDTYHDPLRSSLLRLHYCALAVVGSALLLLNLAIEYGCFHLILTRFSSRYVESGASTADEPADVAAERRRVAASLADTRDRPLSLATLGNINRGFVHTEGKKNSLQRSVVTERDVVQCVGLSKGYPTRGLVVDNLTLGIAPGQCIALLGENGAGKSTTFAMLTGEVRPSRGRVYLDGRPRAARGLARGLISYCPQTDAIDPLLTVRETLQLYCDLRGINDEEHVIERAVDMFELGKYVAVRSGALSGGNKRKLCAALAFASRAPTVLLDEPTSGMDPVSRGCVWRACAGAAAARRGVLLSTHALADARRAAAAVALLRAGRLIACQPLADCLDRFGGGYVVQCACADAAAAWRGAARACRAARLRLLHQGTLHFHVPTRTTVDEKPVVTRLSDIFRAMSALQAAGAVLDYTVAQSSLEQMFLNYRDTSHAEDKISIEPLPSPHRTSCEQDSVTSL